MVSQFIEGGALAKPDPMLNEPAGRAKKRNEAEERFRRRFAAIADQFRDKLIETYGPAVGKNVRYAEAFQVCEYGRHFGPQTERAPTHEELRQVFPFLPAKSQGKK